MFSCIGRSHTPARHHYFTGADKRPEGFPVELRPAGGGHPATHDDAAVVEWAKTHGWRIASSDPVGSDGPWVEWQRLPVWDDVEGATPYPGSSVQDGRVIHGIASGGTLPSGLWRVDAGDLSVSDRIDLYPVADVAPGALQACARHTVRASTRERARAAAGDYPQDPWMCPACGGWHLATRSVRA